MRVGLTAIAVIVTSARRAERRSRIADTRRVLAEESARGSDGRGAALQRKCREAAPRACAHQL